MKRRSYDEIADDLLTLERMLQQREHPLFTQLASLWLDVRNLPGGWTFPSEKNGVSGFAGLAPIFVIAEQPSGSRWPPEDKGRRLLYDSLSACGAQQVHLTDIVKTRGTGHEWRQWSPERLQPHIDLLRRELNELKPEKLILLGGDARQLFSAHFTKEAASAKMIPHFGFLRRVPRENQETLARVILQGAIDSIELVTAPNRGPRSQLLTVLQNGASFGTCPASPAVKAFSVSKVSPPKEAKSWSSQCWA